MTITDTTVYEQHNSNGVTTAFSFPHPFRTAEELKVYTLISGTQALKTLTTHYTISGTQDANGFYSSGCTVNFLSAPATGKVTVVRDTAETQATTYTNATSFPARAHELALDKLTMQTQELLHALSRTPKIEDSYPTFVGAIVGAPTAGQAIIVNSGATGLEFGNPTATSSFDDLTVAANSFIVGNSGGSAWEVQSASTARTTLGLVIGTNVQAYDADLTTLASSFSRATSSGPASLALHEDTDNGTDSVILTAPSSLGANRTVTFQDASGTVYITGGTDVSLADGGTGASLADPNADRIMFWDDSAGAVTWLTVGSNLTITGTTLDATGGGSVDPILQAFVDAAPWSANKLPYFSDVTTVSKADLTSFGRTLLAQANAADVRTELGLVIGTNVQAFSLSLLSLATDYTYASASSPASLALAEDTDNGSHTVTITAPSSIASNKTVTLQDVTGTVYVTGGTDVSLADGGTGASLTDPNADRVMFWDDSAGAVTWLTIGTGLTITGTTLDASATAPPLTTKGDLYTYTTTGARLPVGTDGQILMADSSTSSGLVWTPAFPNLRQYMYLFTEGWYNGLGTLAYSESWSGTTGFNYATNDTSRPAIDVCDTSTSATGGSASKSPNMIVLGTDETFFEASVRIPTLADGTDDFEVFIGLSDSADPTAWVDQVGFYYDRDTSSNWIMRTNNDGTSTNTATSTAVAANTWVRLGILINAAGTLVTYYIDGSSVGTVATNIPTGTGDVMGTVQAIKKEAGTNSRTLQHDYSYVYQKFTTPR